MGQIIRAKCTECEYSARLFIGGGFSDCEFEAVVTPFSDEQKNELTLIKDKGIDDFSVQRRPCTCNSCGTIFSCTVLHCNSDPLTVGKQTFYTDCPKCSSNDIRIYSIGETEERCPECGASVVFSAEGFWD